MEQQNPSVAYEIRDLNKTLRRLVYLFEAVHDLTLTPQGYRDSKAVAFEQQGGLK